MPLEMFIQYYSQEFGLSYTFNGDIIKGNDLILVLSDLLSEAREDDIVSFFGAQ